MNPISVVQWLTMFFNLFVTLYFMVFDPDLTCGLSYIPMNLINDSGLQCGLFVLTLLILAQRVLIPFQAMVKKSAPQQVATVDHGEISTVHLSCSRCSDTILSPHINTTWAPSLKNSAKLFDVPQSYVFVLHQFLLQERPSSNLLSEVCNARISLAWLNVTFPQGRCGSLKGPSSSLPPLLASLPLLLASCFSFSAVDSDGPICMQRQAGKGAEGRW